MPSSSSLVPRSAIWALGATQILGYGTTYYSYSILAPAIAVDLNWPLEWVFGALSISLLIGGLMAPAAGRASDRFGGARTMTIGSLATVFTLVALALAPEGISFTLAMVAMEITTAFVLYNSAFALLVQVGGRSAQRSITHLTLIAGFSSTLFWPFTAWLVQHLGWREIFLLYAAANLLVCFPLHFWLQKLPRWQHDAIPDAKVVAVGPVLGPREVRRVFVLMTLGFALCGFVVSAFLVHMVPLMTTLGVGGLGVLVTTLFGPSQVLARLINMVFGGRLKPTALAMIAAVMLPIAALLLAIPAFGIVGALGFAVFFGLGSGLSSIVLGTLPLMLFGPLGYGARLGAVSAWRLVVSSLAPFLFAALIGATNAYVSLWALALLGTGGVCAFAAVAIVAQRASAVTDRTPPHAA